MRCRLGPRQELAVTDEIRATLALARELEETLPEDRVAHQRLRSGHDRVRRIVRVMHPIELRERVGRLTQLVQRLCLDQIHLGETEEREVTGLAAACRRARDRD